jgi:hypothetical protein
MTPHTLAPRWLLAVGLLIALAGCGGTKRQTLVGTWKFSSETPNPSDTITFDEQGGVEWKRPGGWPKEGTSPGFPAFLGPLFESGGRGNWELTPEGKLRLFGERPDGTEWSQAHNYRIDGEALVISAEGEYTFRRLKN